VIGHLHLVGDLPHVSLGNLSKTHGLDGLMLLRLGTVPNLVVSSPRAAEKIMRTHDHLFASRPPSKIAEVILYGPSSDIALSPYGEHWRQARRLVTTHLFTVKKVQSYRIARQQEVTTYTDTQHAHTGDASPALDRRLHDKHTQPPSLHLQVKQVTARISEAAAARAAVDLSETFNAYANDVVCRVVSGKFFRAEGRNKLFRELIDANSALLGGFNLEDCFPRLAKVVHVFNRFASKKAEASHRRWDELLETIISDHENSMNQENGTDEQDFIDVLLSVQQEFHGITRDHIKAILMVSN
jgi:hypothetical protein